MFKPSPISFKSCDFSGSFFLIIWLLKFLKKRANKRSALVLAASAIGLIFSPGVFAFAGDPNLFANGSPSNVASIVSGSPVVTSSQPVTIQSPVGSPVSTAAQAAAASIANAQAGVAVANAQSGTYTFSRSVPLPKPVAASLFKSALTAGSTVASGAVAAAGAGAAAVGSLLVSPGVVAAFNALAIGTVGYNIYQALKSDGVALDPVTGALTQSVSLNGLAQCKVNQYCDQPVFVPARGNMVCSHPTTSPPLPMDYPEGWAAAFISYSNPGSWAAIFTYTGAYFTCPYPVGVKPAQPVTSMDAVALEAELNKVIAADISNALALDAANYALTHGQDIPPSLSLIASPAVYTSPFVQLSTSVDALGVTTSQLSRNVSTVTPDGVATGTNQKVSLVNGAAQSSTSTPVTPEPSPAAVAQTAAQAATQAAAAAQQAKQLSLCATNPDILACNVDVDGDVPDNQQLVKKDINLSITPVVFAGIAMCPAPINVGFGRVINLSSWCGFLAMLRPVLLLFAWLAAARIVLAPIKV